MQSGISSPVLKKITRLGEAGLGRRVQTDQPWKEVGTQKCRVSNPLCLLHIAMYFHNCKHLPKGISKTLLCSIKICGFALWRFGSPPSFAQLPQVALQVWHFFFHVPGCLEWKFAQGGVRHVWGEPSYFEWLWPRGSLMGGPRVALAQG